VVAVSAELAAKKFQRQLTLGGLGSPHLREASLRITRLPGTSQSQINGQLRAGCYLSFVARVLSDHGQIHECEKQIFVAPHDPALERASAS
jgi:hypothetical protein